MVPLIAPKVEDFFSAYFYLHHLNDRLLKEGIVFLLGLEIYSYKESTHSIVWMLWD